MRDKDKAPFIDLSDNELAGIYQEEQSNIVLEILFDRYENYIHKVASSYYWRTSLENDDILSKAYMGFISGVEKFDVEMDGYFMYYVGSYMKASIFIEIDDKSRLVRIPVNRLKDMRKIDSMLINSADEFFTVIEVSEYTGINEDKVYEYLMTTNKVYDIQHLENSLSSDEDIYSKFNQNDLEYDLQKILNTLTEQEYFIITRLFGLFGNLKMDKSTIKEKLGVSGERIRQVKDRCIRKLRHSSFSSILIQYLD